eukprot:CAMPEP_0116033842 /NCGR_PEP_ID=MMETSP0321-20121206/19238_1 /TAXON_ID=163516 /ORGANISM="Leptocylindrus danicus var. danicus, Strain B650" /LENGTH=114 /DNA_ID=CAMNT_0003510011 /DNA_START=203 /DNA_END=547 /DNA_ORIENTATION=-
MTDKEGTTASSFRLLVRIPLDMKKNHPCSSKGDPTADSATSNNMIICDVAPSTMVQKFMNDLSKQHPIDSMYDWVALRLIIGYSDVRMDPYSSLNDYDLRDGDIIDLKVEQKGC